MGWISGIAIYAIIWWLVIFMVLPWGVQTIGADDVAKGHAPSAPRRPRMLLKAAVTTVVAAVTWLIVFAIIESGAISFSQQ
jgi:predicted secreted protein